MVVVRLLQIGSGGGGEEGHGRGVIGTSTYKTYWKTRRGDTGVPEGTISRIVVLVVLVLVGFSLVLCFSPVLVVLFDDFLDLWFN